MKFTEKENSFELSIVGYQFPNAVTEPYDSNWLSIQLHLSDRQGVWDIIDPCLLTYEVSRLADWFNRINSGNFSELACDFIEPVISFGVVDYNQQRFLRIRCAIEALPPWTQDQDEYFIEFTLSAIDLKLASDDLREHLENYPQRAAR